MHHHHNTGISARFSIPIGAEWGFAGTAFHWHCGPAISGGNPCFPGIVAGRSGFAMAAAA